MSVGEVHGPWRPDQKRKRKKRGESTTPLVPNLDQIIQPPVPPTNEEVVETQPVIPAEVELCFYHFFISRRDGWLYYLIWIRDKRSRRFASIVGRLKFVFVEMY